MTAQHSPLTRGGGGCLTGILLALSFPRLHLAPLAFIAFIPLFYAIEGQPLKKAFLWGWLAGLAYFAGSLSWVTISMHQYGGLPWAASYFFMLLFAAYLAVYVGLFTLSTTFINKNLVFIAPVCWTALEYLRGHLLTGFPWNALGYSQYQNLPLIQMADITSVYGVSFTIVLINAALYGMIKTACQGRKVAWSPLLVSLSFCAFVFMYGFYRLGQPMGNGQKLSVGVTQGNVDQAIKWDVEARDKTLEIYERLSLSFVNRPQLVIWPESALPVFFQNEPFYQQKISDLAHQGGFYLLFGSPAFKPTSSGQIALLNSAYLVSPTSFQQGQTQGSAPTSLSHSTPVNGGGAVLRYDKMHLVPFGEYVPLRSILFFVDKMVTGIGDFVPGEGAYVMEIPNAKIGTAICFEVIFPELVRHFTKNGANLMVTITNDAWFGQSAAPYQHFSMVVFRAIENRVPFARSANTGISGFIDAHGIILQETGIFIEEARLAQLEPGFRKTFYTTFGDFFAIGCVGIFIILLVLSYRALRSTLRAR
jgi:apolipoprotein N-acyltransferase